MIKSKASHYCDIPIEFDDTFPIFIGIGYDVSTKDVGLVGYDDIAVGGSIPDLIVGLALDNRLDAVSIVAPVCC